MTDVHYAASHCGICVSDLDRSLRFYRDGLGFAEGPVYKVGDEFRAGLEVAGEVAVSSLFLHQPGMTVELLHYDAPGVHGHPSASRNQLGLTHLSFEVADVDAAAARLVQYGGEIIESTRTNANDPSAVQIFFLADPDGTRIELMHTPQE